MKIALCISGQPRTFDKCIDSLIKFIVNPLLPDIFIHLWDTSEVPAYMSTWYGLEKLPEWPKFEISLLEKLQPKGFIIQPQKYFDESLYRDNCTVENNRLQAVNFQHFQSMFYSIKMANGLKYRHELLNDFKYDCVIRVRPDMKFQNEIPKEYLQDLTKLYYFSRDSHGGINDKFAFSNSNNMNQYSECFDNLQNLFINGCNLHPETLLREHIKSCKIPIFGTGIPTIGELIR